MVASSQKVLIDYQFESWKTTLWDKIDTDELMKLINQQKESICLQDEG